MKPPSARLIGGAVLVSILLTGIHFTDNVLSYNEYPTASWIPDWFAVVVGASWFAFTAIGIYAYVLYRAGRYDRANVFLLTYSFVGFASLGHFAFGSPSELTSFAIVTVMIDAVVGIVVLSVAIWSMRSTRPASV
ncbi:MAG: hypothetical protein JHC87_03550 [Thermoleophilaceae bacterium]|nr:hypothetical protein [Thermoleophilaceae bacterium]